MLFQADEAEIQIGGGSEDNSKIVFLIAQQSHTVIAPYKNRLGVTVLMMGHNICFNRKI